MYQLVTRQLYKYVTEVNDLGSTENNKLFKMKAEEILAEIKKISKLTEEDVAVFIGSSDNGQKQDDPMKNVKFYDKHTGKS